MKIIGIPGVNGLGHTQGCEKAPEIILKGIRHEKIELNRDNIEEQQKIIYESAKQFLKEKCVFVGGDHSISYPIVMAFMGRDEKEKCLIIFDAHADAMLPMREPTHEEWLRAVVEAGFAGRNVILIGARAIEHEESEFLKTKEINLISVEEAANISATINKIKKIASGKEIYLSLDLDVINPEEFSSTGYIAKGGLSVENTKKLLDEILKLDVSAGDIVEFNPERGEPEKGLIVARKMLRRFISALAE